MKLSIQLKSKDKSSFYVYICLFHNKCRVLISTPYIIGSKDVENGKITNTAKYAEIYNNELLKYQHKINHIAAPELLSANDIKAIITSSTIEHGEAIDFFSFGREYVQSLAKLPNRARTAERYATALNLFEEYLGRKRVYTFELTKLLFQGYINKMQDEGKKPLTISNNINWLKAIFNACKDRFNDYDLGIINIKNEPFRKLVLPKNSNLMGRKALSVDDIRILIQDDWLQGMSRTRLKGIEYYRDMFLLSFYLLGINPVDMYNLKDEQYKDGRITYSRKKTLRRAGGSFISIPVSSKAHSLILKHKGRGGNLLDLADKYVKVEGVVGIMSRMLKDIHSLSGISIPKEHFTWYSARHTWASIAANECHFSDAEVARALNHQSEHKVTRGYIRPDWSLLDRMNEAVMNVIL